MTPPRVSFFPPTRRFYFRGARPLAYATYCAAGVNSHSPALHAAVPLSHGGIFTSSVQETSLVSNELLNFANILLFTAVAAPPFPQSQTPFWAYTQSASAEHP